MAQNLSQNFQNIENEANTIVDYFIESIRVRLLGCGIHRSSTERIADFLLPAFLIVY